MKLTSEHKRFFVAVFIITIICLWFLTSCAPPENNSNNSGGDFIRSIIDEVTKPGPVTKEYCRDGGSGTRTCEIRSWTSQGLNIEYITRYVDSDTGIVCYMQDGKFKDMICFPIEQTKLEE